LVLFILFYLDNSIQRPAELADKTNFPVLGQLPLLRKSSLLDLKQLWENNTAHPEIYEYKNQLRSIRFEIDNALNGPSLLNITSLSASEGKTLFATSLASAYLMTGKKVMLIDSNFNNPSITEITKPQYFIEDLLTGKIAIPQATGNEMIIMGNRGGDKSLFEITSEQTVHEKMQALKREFDIVLIETSAIDQLNKSKEWIKIADKVVAVFEANKTITTYKRNEIKYLQTINDKFIGWVMNKLPTHKTQKKKGLPVRNG